MNTDDRALFERRLPRGVDFVTPKELADAVGFSARTITSAIQHGKIDAILVNASGGSASKPYNPYRIPIECALLFMVEAATYSADSMVERFCGALGRMDRKTQIRVQAQLTRLLSQG